MNRLIKTIFLIIFTAAFSHIFAQDNSKNTIFTHSTESSLNTDQSGVYNTITRQDQVLEPRIVVFKDKSILTKNSKIDLNVAPCGRLKL